MEGLGILEIIGIVTGVLLLSGGTYAWFRVRKQVRIFSKAVFGTPSLREGLEHQADILAAAPKSVTAMTRLCLPRIEEDFPEFNWLQWKQRCENMLRGYLEALETQDISKLDRRGGLRGESGISQELRRQTEFLIKEQMSRGVRERFGQVKIHQTEISRYQKEAGLCIIKLQSAVEYYYEETAAVGREESGEDSLVPGRETKALALRRQRKGGKAPEPQGPVRQQNRYNMELVYIQDAAKLGDYATAVGATCPNCGAPVTRLGSKFCEYCGTGIIPIDIRVWKLHRIEKE